MNSQEVSPAKKRADLLQIFAAAKRFTDLSFPQKLQTLQTLKLNIRMDEYPFEENVYVDWTWEKIRKKGNYENDIFLLFCIGADSRFGQLIVESLLGCQENNYYHPNNDGYSQLKGSDGLGVWMTNKNILRAYPQIETYLKKKRISAYGNCENWIKFILALNYDDNQKDILQILHLE